MIPRVVQWIEPWPRTLEAWVQIAGHSAMEIHGGHESPLKYLTSLKSLVRIAVRWFQLGRTQ